MPSWISCWPSGKALRPCSARIWRSSCEATTGPIPPCSPLLSKLVEKGYLSVERQGRHNLYRPLVSEADYRRWANRSFLGKMYQSSLRRMVASLVRKPGPDRP
ncbi:MAG: BlaI/MecI/CopY family transcriptional regulator [Angelakisella sp.]